MTALPEGWEHAELDELRGTEPNAITDGPYGSNLKSTHYSSKGARVVRLGNIGAGKFLDDDIAFVPLDHFEGLQKHRVVAGDIVVAALGDPIGRACILPEMADPALVKADCFRFRTSAEISSRYVMLWLNSEQARQSFFARSHGLGRVRINLSDFRGTTMPIAPLSEQRRIVVKIDSLAGKSRRARDHLDHIPRLVEKYKQAVLAAAFRGDLTAGARSKHASSGWTKTTLAEVCDHRRPITYGVIKLGSEVSGGVPCLRTSNVRWLHIDVQGMKSISKVLSDEYHRTILSGGEVLVNVRGTLGGVAVVPSTMSGWNVSREVAVAAVDARHVLAEYAAYWIAATSSQRWLSGVEKGVAYTGINIEDLRKLPVAFPNQDEQREIVRRIETAFDWIDRLASEATSARRLIDHLDQSVLAKAFRGELVPQDPTDEPASVLLGRIRAERGAVPKATRGRIGR